MRLVDEILRLVAEKVPGAERFRVEKACIGLGYTGVKLDSGHAGLSYTLSNEMAPYCCQVSDRAGRIAGSSALEVASMARSWEVSESVLGYATLNALSQVYFDSASTSYSISRSNLVDELKVRSGDLVVMIGSLHPFIDPLRKRAGKLLVVERNPMLREEWMLPDTAVEEVLPEADVVIATGATLPNGTVDRIVELAGEAHEFGLVGPSANVIPDPLFDRGVTVIGGVRVLDPDRMIQIVAEGGGTPQLKAVTEFITVRPTR
ncbi:MAG: DUF364 domain-containing protein [Candidatus Bathyarchaeia archaeon]